MSDFDGIDELSADARALLDGARGADEPTAGDRARVKRALMATLAAGGAAAAASTAAASTSTAASAGTAASAATATGVAGLSTSVKLAAALLVAGAVGGTVVIGGTEAFRAPEPAQQTSAETRSASPAASSSPSSARAGSPTAPLEETPGEEAPIEVAQSEPADDALAPVEASSDTPMEADVERPLQASPEPTSRARLSPRPATVGSAGSDPAPPIPSVSPNLSANLAEEVALLRRAQGAINRGEPDAALALLAQHARAHPDGVMAAERDAARVVALCRAGREAEARSASTRFLRENPQSPLRARVQSACAD
ncbi:MAG: hypothetical protein RLO52_08150 [Sandaracinaceae bacterium]